MCIPRREQCFIPSVPIFLLFVVDYLPVFLNLFPLYSHSPLGFSSPFLVSHSPFSVFSHSFFSRGMLASQGKSVRVVFEEPHLRIVFAVVFNTFGTAWSNILTTSYCIFRDVHLGFVVCGHTEPCPSGRAGPVGIFGIATCTGIHTVHRTLIIHQVSDFREAGKPEEC